MFIHEALTERTGGDRRLPVALLAVLGTTLAGTLDESIQALLPSRVFDPQDVLFNVLAGAMAITASMALQWGQRLTRRG